MCGRAYISKSAQELISRFEAIFDGDFEPNYNMAPSQQLPVIKNESRNRISLLRWGLVPSWAKDITIGYKMINARSETLLEKTSFKNLVGRKRCLVPADGYYEWKKTPSGKVPFAIHLQSQETFAMAGLWTTWQNEQGHPIESYTIITTEAAPEVEHIHNRMPVILTPEEEKLWLSEDLSIPDVMSLLKPYPGDEMDYYSVSQMVNSPANNRPELLDPVPYVGGLFD